MKIKLFTRTFFFFIAIIFISCGSEKSKLVGNWKVAFAQVYSEVIDNAPDDTAMQTMLSAMENEWKGCIYKLKEDGSFEFIRKEGESTSGKWSYEEGLAIFTPDNGEPGFKWSFYNNEIVIAASDGSIMPNIPTGGDPTKNYISLTLQPVK